MRVVLVMLVVSILAGCEMSNEQRIEAFKACNDAGMRPEDRLTKIVCMAR